MKKFFLLLTILAVCLAPLPAARAEAGTARNVKVKDFWKLFDLATLDTDGKDGKVGTPYRFYSDHDLSFSYHIQGFSPFHFGGATQPMCKAFVTHSTGGNYGDFGILSTGSQYWFELTSTPKSEKFNHPGGFQTIGDYAVVPVESDSSKAAYIYAFDLSGVQYAMRKPDSFNLNFSDSTGEFSKLGNKAGIAAICDYRDHVASEDIYLLAVHGGGAIRFYKSGAITVTTPTLKEAVFKEIATIKDYDKFISKCPWEAEQEYHGMSLIVEETSSSSGQFTDKVYLLGFVAANVAVVKDFVQVFDVSFYDSESNPQFTFDLSSKLPIDSNKTNFYRHMVLKGVSGLTGTHFRWGSSALARQYEDGGKIVQALELYGTERKGEGGNMYYDVFSSGPVGIGDGDSNDGDTNDGDTNDGGTNGGGKTPKGNSGGCSTFGFGMLALVLAVLTVRKRSDGDYF